MTLCGVASVAAGSAQEHIAMPARASNGPPRAPAPRDAIALAFDEIGGVSALAEWVAASDDNRKIFYATIYPKILSLDFGGEPDGAAIDEVRYTIVRP
jgi:hypothetical protein